MKNVKIIEHAHGVTRKAANILGIIVVLVGAEII